MAIDRSKIQKQADGFVAAGRIERGIEEFLKLLEDKPNDLLMMNRIGDFLRWGVPANRAGPPPTATRVPPVAAARSPFSSANRSPPERDGARLRRHRSPHAGPAATVV